MCNYKLMWKTFKHFWKTFVSDVPKERPWSGDYLLFPSLMIQSSGFKPFPDLDTRPGSFHLKTLIKLYQYIDTLLTTMPLCSYILISDTNIFIPILIMMYLSRQLFLEGNFTLLKSTWFQGFIISGIQCKRAIIPTAIHPITHIAISVNSLYHESWSFKCQPHKMVKHTQTLSVFDHFVGLALKGLK